MNRNAKSLFCWSVRALGVLWLVFLITSRLHDPEQVFHVYSTSWQLERIADAMYRYACEHGGNLPSHTQNVGPNRDGVFPHSWRVYLLPYLWEEELYRKIRLEEPWDSPWNRQFHAQIPDVYRNWESSDTLSRNWAGMTTFCVISGSGTMFPEDGTCRNLRELRGEEGRKILILESCPDCWMNPYHDVKIENALRPASIAKYAPSFSDDSGKRYSIGEYSFSDTERGIFYTPSGMFRVVTFNGDVYVLNSRHFPPSVLWQLILVPVE
ncbi:MAG: DUF1559 domain-containing protein [Planctomycetia bacterium]|nr:DUF1559 domain-containing protein [Planctomycetia bacterium]